MRRALLIALGTIVLALALGLTVFTRSAPAEKPSLRITASAPLGIRGRHFHARERVRISAGTRIARATASGGGSFVVTIAAATRCNTVRVLARGSAGSYVVIKLLPAPACMPARVDG
jgi:hypothetical protein